jgi:hyperosmotically inducible periplasmic protein
MTRTLIAVLALGLAACSDKPLPQQTPKPAAATPTPAPQAQAPEAKAPEAPKPDPNKELAARVKRALEGERKIQAGEIDVSAAEGKVTLWGTAATPADRERAAQVASKVAGVSSVENQIKVVKGS